MGELEVNSIEKENELSAETGQLVSDIPNLFKKRGKVNNYQIKVNLKSEAKVIYPLSTAKTSGCGNEQIAKRGSY